MTSAALLCAALLLLGPVPRRGGRALAAVWTRARPCWPPERAWPPLAAGLATIVGVLVSTPLVAALAGGCACLAARAERARRHRLREERRLHGLVDALAAVAADVRSGRSVDAAAGAAARTCDDERSGATLARALRAPDVVVELPSGPSGEALARVAAAVRLSGRTGCSLAAVLGAVEDDVRARLRLARELRTALAGPRASAALLAALPLVGLAMGSGIGADPWQVLTATGTGQVLLVAGVGLEVAGLAWSARLARRAVP